MKLLLTILLALLYASFMEYFQHRFIMHSSNKHEHITFHHVKYHGKKSYEHSNINPLEIVSDKLEALVHLAWSLPIAIIIFMQNKVLSLIFAAVYLMYTLWGEYLHLYFHEKKENALSKFKFFKILKEHHKVHHYQYNYNYGVSTTFWDVIFRTKWKD